MASDEQPRDPLPEHFPSVEAAAAFWDTHDLTDYDDLAEDVAVTVSLQRKRYLLALDPELAARLAREAVRRGLSAEALANLWLSERLGQNAA